MPESKVFWVKCTSEIAVEAPDEETAKQNFFEAIKEYDQTELEFEITE